MFNIKQDPSNPILHPYKKNNWEEVSACNGCPIIHMDKKYIVYRAIGNPDLVKAPNLYQSIIAVTEQNKKGQFLKRSKLITPKETWEEYGCEDPRITKIGKSYYIFYTALSSSNLGPDSIKVAVAITDDLKNIKERHLVTPFNAKAMAMFPEKINGYYYAILTANTDQPPAKIAIRQFKNIEDLWDEQEWKDWYRDIDYHVLKLNREESDLTEVGAPPIKTKDGWLLIYSHIQNYFSEKDRIFGIEAVLLDIKNPKKIIGRTNFPIMVPDQLYSKYGFISNVSFPTGAILNGNELEIYYGAADTTTAAAKLDINLLLDQLKPKTKMKLFKRVKNNPVLSPTKNFWEGKNIMNPAAVDINGVVRILYRAQSDDGTSMIGYAESKDGKKIDYRDVEPCYVPRINEELKINSNTFSGCEDPRLTEIDDKIYMSYTAYNGVDSPKIAISSINKIDLDNRNFTWSDPVVISPQGHDDKDGCLFPQKFKNGYLFIHRISGHITADYVNDLNFSKNEIDTSMEILEPRKGMWDSLKVGLASPPHLTKYGWLMFYHGVSEDKVYRVGAALLDKDDPTVVLGRSTLPIFEPEELYEKIGEVNNVVFPCGSLIRGNEVLIYYGCADRHVGIAYAKLDKILAGLL